MSIHASGRRRRRGSRVAIGASLLGLVCMSGPSPSRTTAHAAGAVAYPAGLEIFSLSLDDNGVLDPGETALAAPSWRAPSNQAVTLTGVAKSFVGPAGATYSVPDAAAAYGTIPAGVEASCWSTGDCYQISVTDNPSRPLHWDATLNETVQDAGGRTQTKAWTVHVGGSFSDTEAGTPDSAFYVWSETMLHYGIMGGCGGGKFCPELKLLREEMAVLLLVAKEGPGYSPVACVEGTERFTDVPHYSPFCRWVEEVARRGIDTGCGPTTFCPTDPVGRGYFTKLVLTTQHGVGFVPPSCTAGSELFDDVDASDPVCPFVEEMARDLAELGPGDQGDPTCDPTMICPTEFVARGAAGRFLAGGFGLKLYKP